MLGAEAVLRPRWAPCQLNLDLPKALYPLRCSLDLLREGPGDRASRVGESHEDVGLTARLDLDLIDEPEIIYIKRELWVIDLPDRLDDVALKGLEL
jgi:hypothetical protein